MASTHARESSSLLAVEGDACAHLQCCSVPRLSAQQAVRTSIAAAGGALWASTWRRGALTRRLQVFCSERILGSRAGYAVP